MGIALLTMADLFTPFQSLADRWMPLRRRSHRRHSSELRYVGIRPHPANRADPPAARPLRVVRTLDTGQPSHPGRMIISGRMADVCAELDRLAASEAAGMAPLRAPMRH
jgi:hypothetical protein